MGSGSAGLVHSLFLAKLSGFAGVKLSGDPVFSVPPRPPRPPKKSPAVTLLLPDAPAVLLMFTALLPVGPFAFCLGTSFSLQQLLYRRARVGTRTELVLVKGPFGPAHSLCLRGQWGGEVSPRGGAQGGT